ncbi:MAG: DciA family protein [Gammaproteobacteria bacterium]
MPMPSNPSAGAKPGRMPLEALPSALCARARRLATLRDALAAILTAEEAPHFVGVSAHANELVIFTDSPAWCTRLRYRSPQLEAAVQSLYERTPRLVFRTQPPQFRSTAPPPRQPLSERAAATLNASARTIADAPLAAALRRLAGRRT